MTEDAASCCVTSEVAADTTTASNVTMTSVNDNEANDHHERQQQDSVVDITNDFETMSVSKSDDQSADADTKLSSACQFPIKVVAMSTTKPAAGIRLVFYRSLSRTTQKLGHVRAKAHKMV